MSMSISSISPGLDIKNSVNTNWQQQKQGVQSLFAAIQAGDLDSAKKAFSSISTADAPATPASADTSVQIQNLTDLQKADVALLQGRIAPQSAAEAKATILIPELASASSSTVSGTQPTTQSTGSTGSAGSTSSTSTPQTAPFAPQTFKAIFGELPSGLDRTGLSGIIDKQGHNMTNAEIISYFDQNPTTTQMEVDRQAMGLNDYQFAHAEAIALGQTYHEPVWVPNGASTIGGDPGGSGTKGSDVYTAGWGAWGNGQSASARAASAGASIHHLA